MKLSLKVITPQGVLGPFECDSVHLTISDDLSGKGGGSYGIRPGHTKALLSLQEGPLDADLEEQCVFFAKAGSGFASIEQNIVTVVVETCQIESK
ncbi:MAG: hypothetical protein IJN80_00430 [Clostridia bacterium]|nr:hypothetical protein [Clostridia bacterium]